GLVLLGRGRLGRAALDGLQAGALAHLDVAIDLGAILDDERSGHDVARDARGLVQHDLRRGDDVAGHGAAHGHRLRADRRLDLARLADDQGVLARDLAAEPAVDPDGVLEHELALELGALVDERGEAAGTRGARGRSRLVPFDTLAAKRSAR